MSRIGVTAAALAVSAWTLVSGPARAGSNDATELVYLNIEQLQSRMEEGTVTASQLVGAFVQRIAEIDKAGPGLNSVIEVNPDAFAIAAALDQERAEQGARGPLHGIPVLLKANIDTGDRMDTTAGSLALAGYKAPDDAFHVAALREAGAVILGKTNLSEWANFRSTESSSGWSSIGGQTRNPYAVDRNPCGSSSGSAVAVAAGLSLVAIGTETNGSIMCPSSINGVVGIKPTVGLVSRDGIIPIAHTQDTAGPMARSVRDAAILLSAMASHDPSDPAATGHPGARDYAADLDSNALQGARIGVWRGYSGAEAESATNHSFATVLETVTEMGATLVDPIELEIPEGNSESRFAVLLYEFKADLNSYLAAGGVDPSVDTLAELIEFNREHADSVMPWFGQEIFEMAEEKGPLSDPEYLEALENTHVLMAKLIDDVMREHDLDALIAPTRSPAWTTDLVYGDSWDRTRVSSSTPAAVSGYPAITIPMGQIHGLPVGVGFFGLPYTEDKLIGFAYALEQELDAWSPPDFRSSVEMR
jgi:amidase